MPGHGWMHAFKHANHNQKKDPKGAALVYIVIGFFFAPMLIGIPIMLYGIYLLCSSHSNSET